MTILFFSRLFYPHIGGVETHVLEISKELLKLKYKIVVVTEQYDVKLSVMEIYKGIQIYRIPLRSESKKYTIWKWLWKNRKLIEEADIIHAHDVAFWFFPFRILYPLKKFYTTFHGYETVYPPSKKAIVVRKISENISKGTISIGEYIKKWYKAKPDVVMYGGTTIVQNAKLNLSTKLRASVQSNNPPIRILFVGRIEEDNGVKIYEQALKQLKDNNVQYNFKTAGDGSRRRMFEQYGAVRGFVKNVQKHVEWADVVFASSYLSILDAFIAKKTVISVYTNPLKEDYLKMTPFAKWITISNNPSSISRTLMTKSWSNISIEKAYKWAHNNTWKRVALEYEKLWQK